MAASWLVPVRHPEFISAAPCVPWFLSSLCYKLESHALYVSNVQASSSITLDRRIVSASVTLHYALMLSCCWLPWKMKQRRFLVGREFAWWPDYGWRMSVVEKWQELPPEILSGSRGGAQTQQHMQRAYLCCQLPTILTVTRHRSRHPFDWGPNTLNMTLH